jgi:hypothetical protein
MIEIKDHLVDTWWIIKKNDGTVMHYGLTPVGMITNSGLDVLETFTDESIWFSKILEYDNNLTAEKIYEGYSEEEIFKKLEDLKVIYYHKLYDNKILLFSGGSRTVIENTNNTSFI